MTHYRDMKASQLFREQEALLGQYQARKEQGLRLNMSRGVPSPAQLELSMPMLDVLSQKQVFGQSGIDERNYGQLDGIPAAKSLIAALLDISPDQVIVGGNSSLNLMYDTICRAMLLGVWGSLRPWKDEPAVKCLCPVPGYDRHFAISEQLGIEMIDIPMTSTGPDMELVEKLAAADEQIKFIWCVPKYSNPQGITYTDETVQRFAQMQTAAPDFRIIWDNAYCVHDLTDTPDRLMNILDACSKAGNPDRVLQFISTSKITFPGAGISAITGSTDNITFIKKQLAVQTIGYDKMNQLAHVAFFQNAEQVGQHMKKHRLILAPKFELVTSKLEQEIIPLGIGSFYRPNGGYFVSFDALDGCAKRIVALCQEAGVTLTNAGATYPYHRDPNDRNIRIAPTFPSMEELDKAMQLFCLCVKLASVEKYLAD